MKCALTSFLPTNFASKYRMQHMFEQDGVFLKQDGVFLRSKTKLSFRRLVGLKIVLKLRNFEISFCVAESKSIVISSLNFQTCTKITNMLFMSRTLLLHFSILT